MGFMADKMAMQRYFSRILFAVPLLNIIAFVSDCRRRLDW
jgi:hypothetical protein